MKYYDIFQSLIPFNIYKIKDLSQVFLVDIDNDNLFEIIGLYDDGFAINVRILKYIKNKWCNFCETKLATNYLESFNIIKTSDSYLLLFSCQKSMIILTYKDNQLIQFKDYRPFHRELYPAYINTLSGKKFGYINHLGKFVIEPRFTNANDFQKNGNSVVEDGLNGLIDESGNYILEPKYDYIGKFSNNRAIIVSKKGFGVIDESGKLLTNKPYDYISDYKNNRALFYLIVNNENLYGYLDIDGNEVIQPIYQNGTDFNHDKAVVKLSDMKFYLINQYGKILQTYNFFDVGELSNGLLTFKQTNDGLYGFINELGKIMIPAIYVSAMPFNNGGAIVSINENDYGLIDTQGNYQIKPVYNNINYLGKNRYAVGVYLHKNKPYLGYKYAMATGNGEFLTGFTFKHLSNFEDSICSVYDDLNTYFIDLSGIKINTLPIINGQGTLLLINDVVKVNVDFVLSYIDKLGNVIYQPNQVIAVKDDIKVLIMKYKPNKDYLVYYPVISGVNQQVNDEFRKKSQIKPINPQINLDYTYYGDFEISFYRKNLLSIKFTGYNYPFGAAHGMPYLSYCHLDLSNSTCFELKDLFSSNINYVKIISEIIADKINHDKQYSDVFPNAYKGINSSQPFYVDSEALYIYFEPYEIAPYVAGFVTFKIDFSEIKSFIATNNNFWQAFN